MVKVQQPAPDFTAKAYINGNFSSVKLSDYKGKWVMLFFYPGDFTFVWATEISAVAEYYDKFKELGVEVLTISVDSMFVHKVWEEKEIKQMSGKNMPFPMLSDLGGSIGKLYNVYDEEMCMNLRGTFLIDPEGVIQSADILAAGVGRNLDEILRRITAIQHVQCTKTEVTPVNWTKGKQTLTPSPCLVGNVCNTWKK